ncbi:hypothetical protein [Tahibacter amnicola]|uniref:Uncharacterized protein n=1 Tax=Tahibacter amnicola TaxID=2976241 RepID=A0ABY6B7J1_9GAMM|nr:hypothetical protein [Tahibacter amnicola]UXI66063.1 hypothetical protein N4264_15020 [Tahibacter amnicola]
MRGLRDLDDEFVPLSRIEVEEVADRVADAHCIGLLALGIASPRATR